jgi:hypothetical protein
MKTIYKYVISNTPEVVSGANLGAKIALPIGSKILCCKIQNEVDVCVWAEVDTDVEQKENIVIGIFGTGWNMNELKGKEYEYIDTFMIGGGVFVYHVYAIKN